ncbi:MAG: hypothetical protein ACFFEA_10555 [Candidatus Thorarchaeota archaeon]
MEFERRMLEGGFNEVPWTGASISFSHSIQEVNCIRRVALIADEVPIRAIDGRGELESTIIANMHRTLVAID